MSASPKKSRERSLVITKLEEAEMWAVNAQSREYSVPARAKPKSRREERRAVEPTCRVCGCTEFNACMTILGPCGWAEKPGKDNLGLCTACE